MDAAANFESRIARLDLDLFSTIDSQSTSTDRQSWLAIQRSIRSSERGYSYLEIGSHLGGSLQQHVVDPKCRTIYSIDKRSIVHPDDRGPPSVYPGNSTARMLENLASLSSGADKRVTCFDTDARDLDAALILDPPDFCFIDGEHTEEAVLSDFAFCRRVMRDSGVICFHDDVVIHRAVEAAVRSLDDERARFVPLKLGGTTFGLFLGDTPAKKDPAIRAIAVNGRRWLRMRRLSPLLKGLVPSKLRPTATAIARFLRSKGLMS